MARLLPHAGRATPTTGPLSPRHPRRSNPVSPARTESHEANATKKHVSRQPQQKKRAFSTATTKKGFSLFATRQPATGQQKKAKMGQSKKTNISLKHPAHAPSTRTRRFLAGLFYGHGAAKPAPRKISLFATPF